MQVQGWLRAAIYFLAARIKGSDAAASTVPKVRSDCGLSELMEVWRWDVSLPACVQGHCVVLVHNKAASGTHYPQPLVGATSCPWTPLYCHDGVNSSQTKTISSANTQRAFPPSSPFFVAELGDTASWGASEEAVPVDVSLPLSIFSGTANQEGLRPACFFFLWSSAVRSGRGTIHDSPLLVARRRWKGCSTCLQVTPGSRIQRTAVLLIGDVYPPGLQALACTA